MCEERLKQAERHVAEGAEHVRRQHEIVARLEKGGHDAGSAKELLGQFEEIQAMHVADRDRLIGELSAS